MTGRLLVRGPVTGGRPGEVETLRDETGPWEVMQARAVSLVGLMRESGSPDGPRVMTGERYRVTAVLVGSGR